DKVGKLFEQFAVVRFLDVRFKREPSLGPRQLEQHEQDAEQFEIGFLVMGFRLDKAIHPLEGRLDRVPGIADNKSPDGRAADNHHLVWQRLENRLQVTACEHIPCKHADNDDDKAEKLHETRNPFLLSYTADDATDCWF